MFFCWVFPNYLTSCLFRVKFVRQCACQVCLRNFPPSFCSAPGESNEEPLLLAYILGASLFYQCWWQNRRPVVSQNSLLSKPFEKGRIAFERTRNSTHGKNSVTARLSIESLCEATKLIPNLGGRQILHFISLTVRPIFGVI